MIRAAVERPMAVTMISLAVAVLGAAAWVETPVDLLPDPELPRLLVLGEWPDAAPETVEAYLTGPLESAAQRIPGVERVTSESFEELGRGQVRIEVELGREVDVELARLQLAERVAGLAHGLPPGAGAVRVRPWVPRVLRGRVGRVILRYTLTGPRSPAALRARLDSVITPALSRVPGVARVRPLGGLGRIVEVVVDPDRLRALDLSPARVTSALRDRVDGRSVGGVRRGTRRWPVTVRSRVREVADLRTAAVRGGVHPVRVSDVAAVRDTHEAPRSLFRVDGMPAVGFEVVKGIGENTVRVAERVKAEVRRLAPTGAPGIRFVLEEDDGAEIRRQLSDLRERALGAAGALLLVILLFLGSARSAAVVLSTVALSVLAAVCLIRVTGLGLNLVTLAGLAVGLGLVVDASIVVMESMHRRRRAGATAAAAADEGAREVALPILASTATTLVVLGPFVYLQGELRVYYLPLGVAAGAMLLASVVVAFTFTPSLGCRVLDDGPWITAPSAARACAALVGGTLRRPWIPVGVAAATFAASCVLFQRHVSRGTGWGSGWGGESHLVVAIRLPRGSDLEGTDRLARALEGRLAAIPQVARFTTRVQGPVAWIRVEFPDSLEGTPVPGEVKEWIGNLGLRISGARVRAYGVGPSFFGDRAGTSAYGITIRGYEYRGVARIAEQIGARLASLPRVRAVDTKGTVGLGPEASSELTVTVDRGALMRSGTTVEELVERIRPLVADGRDGSTVTLGEDGVPLTVEPAGRREADLRSLRNARVHGSDGGATIRVGEVVRIEEREAPARIRREDQRYRREVTYEFRGSRRRGDRQHAAVIASTPVPPGYSVEDRDRLRWRDEEWEQVHLVIALSVVLVYMVTAASFESLRLPLCVILTVPMALTGVFLAFWSTGTTFTREAYVGLVLTGGIVVNNSILLVDSVSRRRRAVGAGAADGRSRLVAAIISGTLARARPILMTTATTVLALLPMVLFAPASDSGPWNAIAYVLIGGLLSSTLLVLAVTPALYLILEGTGAER